MKYQKLHIILTDGYITYGVDTNIDVPTEGMNYWINKDGHQIKVKLVTYKVSESVNNKIFIQARVCDDALSDYGQKPKIVMYDVLIKDLFHTENQAYDYWLNHHKNASLVEV